MLHKVDFRTQASTTLTVDLEDHESEIYFKAIGGLDPVKAEMTSSNLASSDGAQYQSSRRGARNILIDFGVRDIFDRSIRTLRHDMYQYFMPKSPLSLVFYDDEYEPLQIDARVESFDFPLFQKDPGAALSLLCFDPDFYELQEKTAVIVLPVEGGYSIDYDGSIDTGIKLELTIGNAAQFSGGFQISMQQANGETQTMVIDYAFALNDIVTIDTTQGNKSVLLTRGDQTNSILYALSYQSNWLAISNGPNLLSVSANWPASSAKSTIRASWVNKYGGL